MIRNPSNPADSPGQEETQAGNSRSEIGAQPIASSFKSDEGYADETRSEGNQDCMQILGSVPTLPAWLQGKPETERAELAYALLNTLPTSIIAGIVDKLTPLLHMDPVRKLPPEITAQIFSYLDSSTLLTASLASRTWRDRVQDSLLWRKLYLREGWKLNAAEIISFERQRTEEMQQSAMRKARMKRSDTDPGQPTQKRRALHGFNSINSAEGEPSNSTPDGPSNADGDYEMQDVGGTDSSAPNPSVVPESTFSPPRETVLSPSLCSEDPARLNWAYLYRQRRMLEDNWLRGRFTNFQLPHPRYPWEAHRECVYAIQFSGNWLVSGSRDKTIRVWNLETKRLRSAPLVGHTGSVLCLQFDSSEEEDLIVSGSSDRNVIMWRFSTGEKVREITHAHFDSVLSLRFDKRYLVTCSKDKLIKIWNREELRASDENYPKIFNGVGVRYPSYIVDTSKIAPSVLEAQIASEQIKPLPPYTLLMTLDGHGAAVNSIQIDNNEIVSASGDRLVKIWDIRSGSCLKTLVGHQKGIACVQFDGTRIISGSNDHTVRIYDHATGAEVACLLAHDDLVRTLQAGFGDPPGSEETLKLEALAVDHDYWEARRRGEVEEPARRRCTPRSTGSRLPQDVMALGAKIPPGGGGSRWARIVSGSYDETIIIWKRDAEGKWVVGRRLRQLDAARAASTIEDSMAMEFVSQSFGSSLPGVRHLQAPQHGQASPARLQRAVTSPSAVGAAAGQSTPQTNIQSQHALALSQQQQLPPIQPQSQASQQPNQATSHYQLPPIIQQSQDSTPPPPPTSQSQPSPIQPLTQTSQPQPQLPALNPPVGQHPSVPPTVPNANPNQIHPPRPPLQPPTTTRIFKLQFDARKLICASQDHIIVGWDFANGDKNLEEACRFFTGL